MAQEPWGTTDFPRQPAHCLAQVGDGAPIACLNTFPTSMHPRRDPHTIRPLVEGRGGGAGHRAGC